MHGVTEARQKVEVIPESIRLGMYLRKQVQDQSLMLSYLSPTDSLNRERINIKFVLKTNSPLEVLRASSRFG